MRQNKYSLIKWAGFSLPNEIDAGHFIVVGDTGAGGTLMLKSLLRSIASQMNLGRGPRIILVDYHGELESFLRRLPAEFRIGVLDPRDSGGFAWDLSADFNDPKATADYAQLFLPSSQDLHNPFVLDAARSLLQELFTVLIGGRRRWRLSELIHICTDGERLRTTLESHKITREWMRQSWGSSAAFHNVVSTLQNALLQLKSTAAESDSVPVERQISLTQWCKSYGSVLVLRNPVATGRRTYNQLALNVILKSLLYGDYSSTASSWVFIDPLNEVGGIEMLPRAFSCGRPTNVRLAIRIHDIMGLRSTYGDAVAREIFVSCANCSILRLTCPETGNLASELTAGLKNFVYQSGHESPQILNEDFIRAAVKDGSLRARRPYLASEFQEFPLCHDGRVTGCHLLSHNFGGTVFRETKYPIT